MRNDILAGISDLNDYKMVVEAVTGEKKTFTVEESEKLLAVYEDCAERIMGITDQTLAKAVLALDVPGANLLDRADGDALAALCGLYKGREGILEKAEIIKELALCGDVSGPLALVLARAALDTYIEQSDIAAHRNEIKELADFLKDAADESKFGSASAFLIRVRKSVR